MKRKKPPKQISEYLARIGRKGGNRGSKADKRKAALRMWEIRRQHDRIFKDK